MNTRMSEPGAFDRGVHCQAENEWCLSEHEHRHGGDRCDKTCPCRDMVMAGRLGLTICV